MKAGYSRNLIGEILRKRLKKLKNIPSAQKEKKRFATSVPFDRVISLKLKKKTIETNFTFPIKPNQNIFQRIRNVKDKIGKEETAGIYRIKFTGEEGEGSYIGMRKRKIKNRVKEHQMNIKFNKEAIALAKYNSENNINIDLINFQKLSNFNLFNYAINENLSKSSMTLLL